MTRTPVDPFAGLWRQLTLAGIAQHAAEHPEAVSLDGRIIARLPVPGLVEYRLCYSDRVPLKLSTDAGLATIGNLTDLDDGPTATLRVRPGQFADLFAKLAGKVAVR